MAEKELDLFHEVAGLMISSEVVTVQITRLFFLES